MPTCLSVPSPSNRVVRAISSARSAALSALQLDLGLAEPHASLGMISFFTDWDGAAAEQEFQRALALHSPTTPPLIIGDALDLAGGDGSHE